MKFSTTGTSSKTDRCLSTIVICGLVVIFWGFGAYLDPPTSVLGDIKCKLDAVTCFYLTCKVSRASFAMQYQCDTYCVIVPE